MELEVNPPEQQQVQHQAARFTLGKQSSLAPDRSKDSSAGKVEEEVIDPRVRLMYLTNEGDLEGIKELLDSGTNVNFRDIDGRTALHIAACQGLPDVVQLLIQRGAEVDPQDCWGSTVVLCYFLYTHITHTCCLYVCMSVYRCARRNGLMRFSVNFTLVGFQS